MRIVSSHVHVAKSRHLASFRKRVKPLGADYVNTVVARWINKSHTPDDRKSIFVWPKIVLVEGGTS